MQRFYYPNLQNEKSIIIKHDNEIFHQLTKVLRSKLWEKIVLFDWNNYTDLVYEIENIDKRSISIKLTEKIEKKCYTKIKLHLYQALPNKQEKIEFIIQKWVEVWYSSFIFFKSDRSQNLKINDNKIERFKKIIIEATEQSGRNLIPEIKFIEKIELNKIRWNIIYFHTNNSNAKKLSDIKINEWNINIFVWPEWGFSENETQNFQKNNLIKVNLWDYILRTETTWIVVGFYINNNQEI